MPNCRSTSNQNTRVFAPHVILKQDTTRLAINLRSGEGYTLPTFIAGDVIRYDPNDLSYKKSQADSEQNAEVFGVVEAASSGTAVVVVSGSINYPSSRLNEILDGGAGGKDILFLSDTVAGGLTGTIDLQDGSVKIIKPVLQVAPNSSYNAVVVNYIGYKTGSSAEEQQAAMISGGVVFGKEGLDNDLFLDISEDRLLSVSDYSVLYENYGTAGGNYQELVTVSSGILNNGYENKQVYQLTPAGTKIKTGTVKTVNTVLKTMVIEKSPSVGVMDINSPVYVNGTPLVLSSTAITHFTVPKVETPEITQDGESLVPYIKLKESSSVKIPSEILVNTLTANTKISVGGIADLEARINTLQNQINLLNDRVRAF